MTFHSGRPSYHILLAIVGPLLAVRAIKSFLEQKYTNYSSGEANTQFTEGLNNTGDRGGLVVSFFDCLSHGGRNPNLALGLFFSPSGSHAWSSDMT